MLDNPAAYDIMNKLCAAWRKGYVPVAQLDRVSDSDSEGRWFESSRVHEKTVEIKGFQRFFFFETCAFSAFWQHLLTFITGSKSGSGLPSDDFRPCPAVFYTFALFRSVHGDGRKRLLHLVNCRHFVEVDAGIRQPDVRTGCYLGCGRYFFRAYLKNSLRLHHGVFSAISASGNLGQSRTISRKG